jgi:hypothetical protein
MDRGRGREVGNREGEGIESGRDIKVGRNC